MKAWTNRPSFHSTSTSKPPRARSPVTFPVDHAFVEMAILPQQPFLDIATVYRSLQWLQTVGLVAPINMRDGKQRYEWPSGSPIVQVCRCRLRPH